MGGSTSGRWTGECFRYDVAGTGAGAGAGAAAGGASSGVGAGWEALPPMKMVRRRTAAAVAVVPRWRAEDC